MPKVHVTLFPEPIDVPEDEVAILRGQGLLVEDKPAADQPPAKPAPPKES